MYRRRAAICDSHKPTYASGKSKYMGTLFSKLLLLFEASRFFEAPPVGYLKGLLKIRKITRYQGFQCISIMTKSFQYSSKYEPLPIPGGGSHPKEFLKPDFIADQNSPETGTIYCRFHYFSFLLSPVHSHHKIVL